MKRSAKAELAHRLRDLARLEGDPFVRRQLLDDADAVSLGRGRLSNRQLELARKLGIR